MTKTILVVEDNKLNMTLFTDLLEADGHTVLQAGTGTKGFELACERRPDLIVMDIQLPDVSGLEVTMKLKADDALRAIPVLAVTAFAMKSDEKMARDAGCDSYMSKPIDVRKFLARVRKLLDEAAEAGHPRV